MAYGLPHFGVHLPDEPQNTAKPVVNYPSVANHIVDTVECISFVRTLKGVAIVYPIDQVVVKSGYRIGIV